MNLLIVGASQGLGKALAQGLGRAGDLVIGVSRQRPADCVMPLGIRLDWIEADLATPPAAVQAIVQACPAHLDVLIYDVGVWEAQAFTDHYDFEEKDDDAAPGKVQVNVAAPLLLLRSLMPRLMASKRPRIILTGSTSGSARSGRAELASGASQTALNGMADALREGFRDRGLGVTCLQLGYLDTADDVDVARRAAAAPDAGGSVPLDDVVGMVRALLDLSDASFVRELVLPAIRDPRF